MNSPNEDSLFGDDDFSHATCINHCTLKLWFKPKNVKHIQISFYEKFDVSIYTIICYMHVTHNFVLQILSIVNTNNQPNGPKK